MKAALATPPTTQATSSTLKKSPALKSSGLRPAVSAFARSFITAGTPSAKARPPMPSTCSQKKAKKPTSRQPVLTAGCGIGCGATAATGSGCAPPPCGGTGGYASTTLGCA